jgi:hypothetical protein
MALIFVWLICSRETQKFGRDMRLAVRRDAEAQSR